MKRLLLLVLCCCMVLLAGCGKKTSSGMEEPPGKIDCETNTNYTLTPLKRSQTKVKQPAGVCVFQEQLVVCDRSSHKLVVLDMDLNPVREIGELGSAPGEFMEPTGITVFKDELYVLDAGNNRIQILDSEFETTKTIALNPLGHHQGGFRYMDIAVDEEGIIYVSCDSVGEVDAFVYVIENGEIKQSKQPFWGFLEEYNGEVYALDSLELLVEGDNEMGASGRNNLYRMEKTKMEKVKEFPNKYSAADWVFLNDKAYIISSLWGGIYSFSNDYEAEQRITSFEKASVLMYMTALNETDFIITNQDENAMYYLRYQD